MTVFIVLRNGAVEEVFDNPEAAETMLKNLTKKWSICAIVKKEVKSL